MNERILIADDDAISLKNLSRILKREGYDVTSAGSGREAIALLESGRFDLVMADLIMDGGTGGMEVLDAAKRMSGGPEVIIVTGYASVDTAIEAMKKGAFHYLQKPFRAEEARQLAARALEKCRLETRVKRLEKEIRAGSSGRPIVGSSEKIRFLLGLIKQVAPVDANVLITGESGTGKELAASAIHHNSPRAARSFMAINCGSFTEDLLANELFGHEKDAYTGATSARQGLLEAAGGGTVFFDEVGDMPPSMQAKLLRVIQERTLFRVGGTRPVPIDVRIIAATNRDLKQAVSEGAFREDLYYRLNVIPIHIPPLRERREDIPLLAIFLLNRVAAQMNKSVKGFSERAMSLLMEYNYPGNVRELENIIGRAAAFCAEDIIGPHDLPPDIRDGAGFRYDLQPGEIKSMDEVEKDYIHWVLNRVGGNKSEAARMLGIDRTSLHRKIRKYHLDD